MNFMGGRGGRSGGGFRGDIIPEGYEVGQLANFDKRQMDLYKNQFQHLAPDSYLSRLAGGDQSLYNEMEAPALRQFNQLQGSLASRFSQGSGGTSTGLRRSSGFQNTGTAAASNFAQELQANRQNLQRQAIHDLLGLSNQLLGQRPYERDLFKKQEEQPSGWGSIAGGILGGVGGAFFGQPVLGAQLGSAVGSQF